MQGHGPNPAFPPISYTYSIDGDGIIHAIYFANGEAHYRPLFMFNQKTNYFIGATGYHHYDWDVPSIETGYWIRSTCTKKGFMTEAINALTRYAFKQLGMKRITITCDIDNIRSKKIPESLGYHLEGILKSNRRKLLTNEITDTLVYSRYDLHGLTDLVMFSFRR